MRPLKVIFVLGSGHCGGTLIDLMFDAHKDVFGVGEMHSGKATSVCTCGKPAPECELWREVMGPLPWQVQALYKSKLDFLLDRGPYLSYATHKPVDEAQFTATILSQFRTLLARTGKRVIIDSSKEPERVEVLAKSPEIEPYVIELVRDGRGATWTYIDKYKRLFPFFYMWALSNLKIEVLRRRFRRIGGGRGKFLYVRFADLITHPEATLKRLCEEIGIPYDPHMLRFDEGTRHQIEGNRTRFVPGHTIYPDNKWREMPLALRIPWSLCFGWLNVYYTRIRRSFA